MWQVGRGVRECRYRVPPQRTGSRACCSPVLLAVCALWAVMCGCRDRGDGLRLACVTAKKGEFLISVRAEGVLEPLRERLVRSRASGTIARLLEDGTEVKEGDVLVTLDPEYFRRRVIDSEADLDIAHARAKQYDANAQRQVRYARVAVDQARAQLDLAQAELANVQAGLVITKAMIARASGISTHSDPETAKIGAESELETSKIAVADAQRKLSVLSDLKMRGIEKDLDLQRQKVQKQIADLTRKRAGVVYQSLMDGAAPEEIKERGLKVTLAEHRLKTAQKRLAEAERKRKMTGESQQRYLEWRQRYLERAKRDLDYTVIRAPAPGIALIKRRYGRKFVPGRSVYRGRPIVSLPDLSQMKVVFHIEESEVSPLRARQQAQLRIPAIPDRVFSGAVLRVGALVRTTEDLQDVDRRKLRQGDTRVFEVQVRIAQRDERLRPGLNAEVEVVIKRMENVVRVPRNAIRRSGERTYVLVFRGEGTVEREVTIAATNDYCAAVSGGVEAGERVLLDGA